MSARLFRASFALALLNCSARAAWAQTPCGAQWLHGSDSASGDQFGTSLDVDGDVAICGAPLDDDFGPSTGSAYVFRRTASGQWVQTGKFTPPGSSPDDQFGASVAIDGNYAAIGSIRDQQPGSAVGSVAVHELGPSGWEFRVKLTAQGELNPTGFGTSIALSGDALVVGAPLQGNRGVAYFYRRDALGQWNFVTTASASDASLFGRFGASVALRGGVALIGAPGQAGFIGLTGAAYAFELGPNGWQQVYKLAHEQSGSLDLFGSAVDFDGERAVIGAPGFGGGDAGAAYSFRRTPAGQWLPGAKLAVTGLQADDEFGRAVAVEGGRIAVGAPKHDVGGTNLGAVYSFVESAAGFGPAELLAVSGASAYDILGAAVAVADGWVLAGAQRNDGLATDAGRVHAWQHTSPGELTGCPSAISASLGGVQFLRLDAGTALGERPYLVLGSMSGTSPGIPIDGLLLPLNDDAYLRLTALLPNSPYLQASAGATSTSGTALTVFQLPPALFAALAGTRLHHAALVLSGGSGPALHATNAAVLDLVP